MMNESAEKKRVSKLKRKRSEDPSLRYFIRKGEVVTAVEWHEGPRFYSLIR